MTVVFNRAQRRDLPLLLGVAGGTGSGKTYSAMRLAQGLQALVDPAKPFAVIDTENGRALHYADDFLFDHAELKAPFRPSSYAEAIETADKAYDVILVDSMSHEWAGDGGMLDWQEELMGGKESKKLTAWIKPKGEHRKMVTRLLQVSAHVILCFRAEPKVDVKTKEGGGIEIVPKETLTGLDGWIPISEKNLPFELTASFLLMADRPGVPKTIKLEERHREFVALDRPLDETVGAEFGKWAAGAAREEVDVAALEAEVLEVKDDDAVRSAIEKSRSAKTEAQHVAWLRRQLSLARSAA